MDLDITYLGTSFKLPDWHVLILGAPAPEKYGDFLVAPTSRNSMQATANWGLILKIGKRAWEKLPEGSPYKPGEWVMFDDFHPQARLSNGQVVYFIPDTRIMCGLEEPHTFEPWLDFRVQLPVLRDKMAQKRKDLLKRFSNEEEDVR